MKKLIIHLFLTFCGFILAEFQADVRWTCSTDSISIFLRTTKPFEGLIRTQTSKSVEKCQTIGIGTNVAVLKLDLNSDDCGIQYDTLSNSYYVDIDIHSHPILIVEGDKTMKITCKMDGGANVSSNIVDDNDYEMRLLSSRLPVDVVKYSQPYTLQVRPTTSQLPNYFIGQCIARGGNQTVQLTDSIGCALFKSIMSDFARRDYVEEAEIPSMFRFPAAKKLEITCAVIDCDGKTCGDRNCQSESVKLLEKTTASLESEETRKVTMIVDIEQEATTTVLPEVTSTTSTSTTTMLPSLILADDPIVPVPKDLPTYTAQNCVAEYDFKIIYYLCIFLAICSIIGFTMNIILCIMLKRRKAEEKNQKKKPSLDILPIPKCATNHPDFWIIENSKQPEMFESTYASVRNGPSSEYGLPCSSESGSNEIYRRPHLIPPEVRHSNSTFMTHSTTMETDVDSQTSTSYH